MNTFSHSNHLGGQYLFYAQEDWIDKELAPRIIKFQLWQKLRKSEKMLATIFGKIFSKGHLNIFKNYIQNQDVLKGTLAAILYCHKNLRPAVKQFMKKLKQELKKVPADELMNFLSNILMVLKVLWDF